MVRGKYECLYASVFVLCLVFLVVCVTSTLIVYVVQIYMWVNVNVIVCDFVHKCKSVCLCADVKGIHVYLLF